MNFNRCIIGGHLTRDPETRTVGDTSVCVFGLAVNRKWKNKSGEEQEEVLFIDCEAWGKTGEIVDRFTGKGKPLLVQGELKLDQWDDKKTGEKRSKIKLRVDHVTLCGSKGDSADPAKKSSEPEKAISEEDIPF